MELRLVILSALKGLRLMDRYGPNLDRLVVLAFVATGSLSSLAAPRALAADLVECVQLFRTGEYESCVTETTKAIAENDFSENLRLLKIKAEMELGRYSDSKVTLEESLKRFPYSIQLRWIGRMVYRFNGQDEQAKKLDAEITELLTQARWRYTDAVNQVIVGRFFLNQGMDPKKVLLGEFQEVKKRQPSFAEGFLASGELALEKDDYALAAESFQQAVKLDTGDADAHYWLARAFMPSDAEVAQKSLETALKRNPRHIPSLLLIADSHIDAERYDEAESVLLEVAKVNPHQPRALAYRAVLAHLRNQPEKEKTYRAAALRHWASNPEVDYLVGKKLSQKYRFAEGEKYQRRALELDSNYFPAKMQLAQDLLRLGREEEGWRLANEATEADGYNVVAHNLITLQEELAKFRTLEEDGFILRMDAREADIYGERVLDLLKRAKATLTKKYDVTLTQPVIVEMFPRQQDFAIRTFGLPGGAGFLGVCFGTVITANSPASQGESPACWEATLWHEFCHVVTLTKTSNKMPRWLSEGISVYEEGLAVPAWGQSINPKYREMMLGDELTPLSKLSGAFLNAETPLHLQFAYFESALAVEFLVEKHGIETLKRVLVDLGVGMPINDSLARYAGSLEVLDKEFAEFARKRAEAMAPDADWSQPELPRQANAELVSAWLKEHPNNYVALARLARQHMGQRQWEAAIEPLQKMRQLYPGHVGADSPHAMLAQVYRELGKNTEEQAVLEKLAELTADDIPTLDRLTELMIKAEKWEAARKYALQWLAVNPLQPAPHRVAATAAEHLGDDNLAISSYRALLLLNPFDRAEVHLQLATALERKGELPRAKREALLALEETPRYRAAHQRLLAIVRKIEKSISQQPPTNEPSTTGPSTTEPRNNKEPSP